MATNDNDDDDGKERQVIRWFNFHKDVRGGGFRTLRQRKFVSHIRLMVETSTELEDDMFRGCTSLVQLEFVGNSLSRITTIGNRTFQGCRAMKSIVLPSSIQSIGYTAFTCCSSLVGIEIPSGVTRIEESTFSGCTSLEWVKLPASLRAIADGAFSGCSALKTLEIPRHVASIGGSSFCNCTSLQVIRFPRQIHVGPYAFANCSSLSKISLIQIGTVVFERNAFHKCPKLFHVEIANPKNATMAITTTEVFFLEELLSSPDVSSLSRAGVEKASCVFFFLKENIQRIV